MKLRPLLYALLAGMLISALRAPQGLDWTQIGAVSTWTAALFGFGALLAAALFVDADRPAFRDLKVWPFLLAVALGFALHGLALDDLWMPQSRFGFALELVLATLALWRIAGPIRPDSPGPDSTEGTEGQPEALEAVPFVERIGLVVAASGATLALGNLLRHVSLLGLGLRADGAVIGTVMLLSLAVGALAFGGLVSRPSWQRSVLAMGCVLAATSTYFGLNFVARLGPDPLYAYLQRFDLDFSVIGTWRVTGILAGAALVVPGFVAGTALAGAKHPRRLNAVLLGVAAGLVITPYVIEAVAQPLDAPAHQSDTFAFRVLATGCTQAFFGALLVLSRESWRGRIVGLGLGLVALAFPWFMGGLTVASFSPWARATIEPEFVLPTPQGIVTIERTPRGAPIVTLDRRRVSPTGQEELADQRRILYALSLLDEAKRAEPGPRVLFVGQMTRPRAHTLQQETPLRLDRTAPWFGAVEEIESRLFPTGFPPPGNLVEPAEARRRLEDGLYDLVLVMPTHGPVLSQKSHARLPWGGAPVPALGGLGVPEGTIAVAWFDAGSNLARAHLGEHVLFAMDNFQYLSIAGVWGATPGPSPERAMLFPAGPPQAGLGTWSLLGKPGRDRYFPLRQAATERVARAAEGTDTANVARGLALHYAAQSPSSPYESIAQRIEVDEEELRAFYAGATSVDPFTRSIWEGLAWLLTEKRMSDMVLAYLEGVAEKFKPWPTLDHAVASAYLEFLETEEAERLALRGLEAAPDDPDLLDISARLATERGDHQRAVELLRQALARRPNDFKLQRSLGLALMHLDDPAGRHLLEQLLAIDPEDPVLIEALRIGPSFDEG